MSTRRTRANPSPGGLRKLETPKRDRKQPKKVSQAKTIQLELDAPDNSVVATSSTSSSTQAPTQPIVTSLPHQHEPSPTRSESPDATEAQSTSHPTRYNTRASSQSLSPSRAVEPKGKSRGKTRGKRSTKSKTTRKANAPNNDPSAHQGVGTSPSFSGKRTHEQYTENYDTSEHVRDEPSAKRHQVLSVHNGPEQATGHIPTFPVTVEDQALTQSIESGPQIVEDHTLTQAITFVPEVVADHTLTHANTSTTEVLDDHSMTRTSTFATQGIKDKGFTFAIPTIAAAFEADRLAEQLEGIPKPRTKVFHPHTKQILASEPDDLQYESDEDIKNIEPWAKDDPEFIGFKKGIRFARQFRKSPMKSPSRKDIKRRRQGETPSASRNRTDNSDSYCLIFPSTSSQEELRLTDPKLIDAFRAMAEWSNGNPTKTDALREKMMEFLEESTFQKSPAPAIQSPAMLIAAGQAPSPKAQEVVPPPKQSTAIQALDKDSSTQSHDALTTLNITGSQSSDEDDIMKDTPAPGKQTEEQVDATKPHTPTQLPSEQIPESRGWLSTVKKLVATPFTYFGSRRRSLEPAATAPTNRHETDMIFDLNYSPSVQHALDTPSRRTQVKSQNLARHARSVVSKSTYAREASSWSRQNPGRHQPQVAKPPLHLRNAPSDAEVNTLRQKQDEVRRQHRDAATAALEMGEPYHKTTNSFRVPDYSDSDSSSDDEAQETTKSNNILFNQSASLASSFILTTPSLKPISDPYEFSSRLRIPLISMEDLAFEVPVDHENFPYWKSWEHVKWDEVRAMIILFMLWEKLMYHVPGHREDGTFLNEDRVRASCFNRWRSWSKLSLYRIYKCISDFQRLLTRMQEAVNKDEAVRQAARARNIHVVEGIAKDPAKKCRTPDDLLPQFDEFLHGVIDTRRYIEENSRSHGERRETPSRPASIRKVAFHENNIIHNLSPNQEESESESESEDDSPTSRISIRREIPDSGPFGKSRWQIEKEKKEKEARKLERKSEKKALRRAQKEQMIEEMKTQNVFEENNPKLTDPNLLSPDQLFGGTEMITSPVKEKTPIELAVEQEIMDKKALEVMDAQIPPSWVHLLIRPEWEKTCIFKAQSEKDFAELQRRLPAEAWTIPKYQKLIPVEKPYGEYQDIDPSACGPRALKTFLYRMLHVERARAERVALARKDAEANYPTYSKESNEAKSSETKSSEAKSSEAKSSETLSATSGNIQAVQVAQTVAIKPSYVPKVPSKLNQVTQMSPSMAEDVENIPVPPAAPVETQPVSLFDGYQYNLPEPDDLGIEGADYIEQLVTEAWRREGRL